MPGVLSPEGVGWFLTSIPGVEAPLCLATIPSDRLYGAYCILHCRRMMGVSLPGSDRVLPIRGARDSTCEFYPLR